MADTAMRNTNDAPRRAIHPAVQRGLDIEQAYARVPSVSKAFIRTEGSLTCVDVDTSIRSDVCIEERPFTQSFFVDASSGKLQITSPLKAKAESVKLTSTSPSGKLTVNFRSKPESSSGPARTLEVHSRDGGMLFEIDVSDQHADYLKGDVFGDPAWSADEQLLVYVAEQHSPHHKDKQKPPETWEDYPHFGETLYKARRPVLFAVDLRQPEQASVCALTRIETLRDPACTQPVMSTFNPDDGSYEIFATARYLLPDGRRLGQVWCTNRPSSIVKINGTLGNSNISLQAVSPADKACHRPTIFGKAGASPELLYFGSRRGGPHNSSAQLLCQSISSTVDQAPKVLVDHCRELAGDTTTPHGLYISDNTRPYPLLVDGQQCICMSTQWLSRTCLVIVSLTDGAIQLVQEVTQAASNVGDVSWSVLATDGADTIVATRSGIANGLYTELVLGHLRAGGDSKISVQWRSLRSFDPSSCMLKAPADCHMQIIRLEQYAPTEAIFVSPVPIADLKALPAKSKPPFVLYPHGGPNGAYNTAYSARVHGM